MSFDDNKKNQAAGIPPFASLVHHAGVFPSQVIFWDFATNEKVVEHTQTIVADGATRIALSIFRKYFDVEALRRLAKGDPSKRPDIGLVDSARVALEDVAKRLKASGVKDYNAEIELIMKRFDAYQNDSCHVYMDQATAASGTN